MINSSDLRAQLIANVNGLTNFDEAHKKFTDTLVSHLSENLEVKGQYIGIVPPNGAPDPLNGSYKWKVQSISFNVSILKNNASRGFESWMKSLKAAINTITVIGSDLTSSITTTSPSLIFVPNINIDFSDKPKTMDDAYIKLCNGLVESIKSGNMMPISVNAISISNGTGMVTFEGIE